MCGPTVPETSGQLLAARSKNLRIVGRTLAFPAAVTGPAVQTLHHVVGIAVLAGPAGRVQRRRFTPATGLYLGRDPDKGGGVGHDGRGAVLDLQGVVAAAGALVLALYTKDSNRIKCSKLQDGSCELLKKRSIIKFKKNCNQEFPGSIRTANIVTGKFWGPTVLIEELNVISMSILRTNYVR